MLVYGLLGADGEVVYVGCTGVSLEDRIREHWYSARGNGSGSGCHGAELGAWLRSLDAPPDAVVLEAGIEGREELEGREKFWIAEYGGPENLFNMSDGGTGPIGYRHTDEAREKIREANLSREYKSGPDHPLHGKSRPEISGSNHPFWGGRPDMRGENHPLHGKKRPEHSRRMSGEGNPFHGRTHTEEARRKISEAKRGTRLTDEHKEKTARSLRLHWARVKAGEVEHPGYDPTPEDLAKSVEEHLAESSQDPACQDCGGSVSTRMTARCQPCHLAWIRG